MTESEPVPSYYRAGAEHATGMADVIHAAFGARPALDPPSTADSESAETVAAALAEGAGVYATVDGRPAGAIIIAPDTDHIATLRRVSVHPDFQRHGIASTMVEEAKLLAAELGCRRVELFARSEFPELIAYWQHRGFSIQREAPNGVVLGRSLPRRVLVPTAEVMQDLGAVLADSLRPGDVIIATGELGAGKTTLTQGIGRGLGARGQINSPTFVLSRVHPSADGRPDLVHADAYRLGGAAELDDLDLAESLDRSVTVVEWGEDMAEGLSPDRLEIVVLRSADPADDLRTVLLAGVGRRWGETELDLITEAFTGRVDAVTGDSEAADRD